MNWSKLKVHNLRNDAVGFKSVEYDFGQGYGYRWEFFSADFCDKCGKLVETIDEGSHRSIDATDCDGWVSASSPQINYYYPLPDDASIPVNGAERLAGLPLVLVRHFDEEGETTGYGLALTGGGMDLAWEICEGYIRLGYLPPTHHCTLPRFAGQSATARNRAILRACKRSLRLAANWNLYELRRLQGFFKSVR